jgi:hypothetical protein
MPVSESPNTKPSKIRWCPRMVSPARVAVADR